MHHNLVNDIETNTPLGSVITFVAYSFAGILNMMAPATSVFLHIPPVIMEGAQLLAWVVGSIVGCLTIYGWFKKKKKHG